MIVSVIIPIGCRDFLEDCRRSVYSSIEKCAANVKCEVVEVFDDERKGVSWARNEGLKRANGDWIAWVDCDDIVEENWFSEIADAIEYHADSDIIQFDAVEIKKGKERFLISTASN